MVMNKIFSLIRQSGGRPLIVGGWVRDHIMGIPPKDMDIEVYDLDAMTLQGILEGFGKVETVGASFGVMKLWTKDGDYDFALPRRENKTGQGHRGFMVEIDTTMTPLEAVARRDFTFNSIFMDPETNELSDPYNGQQDIKDKKLKHTSPAFAEDPLRVLRGMQFAGRFDLTVDPETVEMCRSIKSGYTTLSIERIWGEWYKWATKSVRPSSGLKLLLQTDWIEMYPQLNALRGIEQEPEWHPEGDVWTHTCHVVDAAADIAIREGLSDDKRAQLVLTSLCHDFGKVSTTEFIDGRIRSRGHETAGEDPTKAFLTSIGCPQSLQNLIVPLVGAHLAHLNVETPRALRRLAVKISPATIQDLVLVVEADVSGRPPLPKGVPAEAQKMLELSKELAIDAGKPQPLVLGRHLMAVGVKPGKELGDHLKKLFELQLDGGFDTVEQGVTLFQKGL